MVSGGGRGYGLVHYPSPVNDTWSTEQPVPADKGISQATTRIAFSTGMPTHALAATSAPGAYFTDRGRLFQSEGGRRFSAMADGVSI